MSASAWVDDLRDAIRRYSQSRRTTPVVRVTLGNGEWYYVMSASSGDPDVLIALDVYPEGMRGIDDLLRVETNHEAGRRDVEHVTPKMLVVPPHLIAKIEILDEHPGAAPLGFRLDE